MSDYGICTRLPENKEAIDIGAIHRERQLEVFRKSREGPSKTPKGLSSPAPTRKWWELWK